MYSFLTFDYELFFGQKSGSIEKCIIEPTDMLLKLARTHQSKYVFYVDSGYIKALHKFSKKYNALRKDLDLINRQIEELVKLGHCIQLHIHPHWEESYFNGDRWVFNTEKYMLSSFSQKEVTEICTSYALLLREFTEKENIFAYRAGGWCIQPFDKIREGLLQANIWLDSTVYPNGFNISIDKGFDFRNSPNKEKWVFSSNPIVEDTNGEFIELPISTFEVSPSVYWGLAFNRLFPSRKHVPIGDGQSLGSGVEQTLKLLMNKTVQPVFLDGYKSVSLLRAYKKYKELNKKYFTAIGHPKAMTSFSFENLKKLMELGNGSFVGLKEIKNQLKSI